MATALQQPISLRTDGFFVDTEVAELSNQVKLGRLDDIRRYLVRSRANCDWQDRLYVLQQVAPQVSIDILNAACEAEPEAADLFVLRCAYYAELASASRGTGTADQVGAARFRNSAACTQAAMADLAKSTQLDSQDPTTCAVVLRPLTIFGQIELMKKAFDKATAIASDLVPVYYSFTTVLSERWGGSHKASVDFARHAMNKATPGSDMAVCLFWAHDLVRTHLVHFNKNISKALHYANDREVTEELNSALESWLATPYVARRSSRPYLIKASSWYRAVGDADRFKQLAVLTGEEFKESQFPAARSSAASRKRGGLLGWLQGA